MKNRLAGLMAACLLATLIGFGAAPGTASSAATETAVGQLRWLAGASTRLPVPAAELRQHVSATMLNAVGGPDGLNQVLTEFGALRIRRLLMDRPTEAEARVDSAKGPQLLILTVDVTGPVSALRFVPWEPTPRSWTDLDRRLRALAPEVSFVVSRIGRDGRCHRVHGVSAGTRRPLGSAFKLYVLGALGQAVADGDVRWDESLPIREAWKSLPSGVLQDAPAGTRLTLRQYADLMISISDNTATDHLIHFLGRDAVQEQMARFGAHDPAANIPFLTTREMFALKGVRYPVLADGYLATPRHLRVHVLDALARIPRSQIAAWSRPEHIDRIEWFASPDDMCRAYAGLLAQDGRPGLAPIGEALSLDIMDIGALGLDRGRFPTVWYKGGSEPGVLTVNYLVRTAGGRVFVASAMVSDPRADLNPRVISGEIQALARGGIQLADR